MRLEDRIAYIALQVLTPDLDVLTSDLDVLTPDLDVLTPDLDVLPPATARCGPICIFEGGSFI